MRVLRAIWSKLHIYVLWLLLSAIFWGWIFTRVTEVPAAQRVTIYILAPACRETELDVELEKSMPEGIRQVRAHLFSYALFEDDELLHADLYVIPASQAVRMPGTFRPLPEPFAQGEELLSVDGVACGVPVKTAASGWVDYPPGETWYLFFGANSAHAEDGAAQAVAEAFLSLP